ncbi:MAG: tRNA (adenosine(37)-N6)-threonylcarbamoyltransferase complex dimerization subunit type 1 TsaB [Chromatiaceae bacterium]|jgi:tRNA threonylcarbamoyladenosine biosynthesis protein TsaB
MKLLAIDTTEDACSAALLIDTEVTERFELAPRRHSEILLPMMDGLLRAAGLRLGDLDALAFARGPGSFTGVRIAVSVAQGAAFGAQLPVVPVSSLQALAQGVRREHAVSAVLIALDARMHEVYWGGYRADPAGIMRTAIAECVSRPQQVPPPGDGDWVAAGSGWGAYAEPLARRCGGVSRMLGSVSVHAQDVASVGAVLFAEGAAVPAELAQPVYLRDEVAWARS